MATGQRQWAPKKTFYVTSVPGDGGADWGYSEKPSDAIELSPYWQKRFLSDMRYLNSPAQINSWAGKPYGKLKRNPSPAKRSDPPKWGRPRLGTTKPTRKSSATGKRPSARLVARRKANRIPGVYPNPADRRGAYWVFTIHDGYVSFRTDSGHTGSTPFAAIPGWKREADIGAAYARWVGLKRGQYEVLDDRTKRNPNIHIDIGSHNASRSRKVRTNPTLMPHELLPVRLYKHPNQRSRAWVEFARYENLAAGREAARAYANKHQTVVKVWTEGDDPV